MAAKKDDKDAVTQMADTASETTISGFDQVADLGRRQTEQFQQLMGAGTRLYGDMGDVSREDVDTLLQTSARLAKGVQDMSWEMMHYTQQSLQLSLRTCNDLMTCRTVEDMLNVQRNFMRQSVDSFLQETSKILELSSGVTSEAIQPIQGRAEQMRH